MFQSSSRRAKKGKSRSTSVRKSKRRRVTQKRQLGAELKRGAFKKRSHKNRAHSNKRSTSKRDIFEIKLCQHLMRNSFYLVFVINTNLIKG